MPLFNETPDVLQRIIFEVMLETREVVLNMLTKDFAGACHPMSLDPPLGKTGLKPKRMLYVDRVAELHAKARIPEVSRTFSVSENRITLYGEETLWHEEDLDLSGIDSPIAIVDMIDGSDLVERKLWNWCSAAIVFVPTREILFSVVQDSHHNLYVANKDGAWFVPVSPERDPRDHTKYVLVPHNEQARKLAGTQHVNQKAASVCFYGQNCEHFTTIPGALIDWMKKENFVGRVYNLAGNPMMCKMADGQPIHVVFEHHVGQYPHDLVPGAYIAAIEGASMVLQQDETSWEALNGAKLIEELARILLRPGRKDLRRKYVLAGSMDLAKHYAQYVLPGYKAVTA